MTLGTAWILDGLEITLADAVAGLLTRADTQHQSSAAVADAAGYDGAKEEIAEVIGLLRNQPGDRLPLAGCFAVSRDEFVLKQVGGHKRSRPGGCRRWPGPTQHQSAIDLQVTAAYSRLHRELERQSGRREEMWPWERVVADAAPCDHIVQLYQGPGFSQPSCLPIHWCCSHERREQHTGANTHALERHSRSSYSGRTTLGWRCVSFGRELRLGDIGNVRALDEGTEQMDVWA